PRLAHAALVGIVALTDVAKVDLGDLAGDGVDGDRYVFGRHPLGFAQPQAQALDRTKAALEALIEAQAVVDRRRASAGFEHGLDGFGPVLDARRTHGGRVVAVVGRDHGLDLGELGES